MSATISNLELEVYFLKEVQFSVKNDLETIPDVIKEIQPVNLEISDLTQILDKDDSSWRCELVIESSNAGDDNHFYDFRIVMIGFFKTNPALSKQNAAKLAESNCPAVLYSTAREIVATLTRRSPYPAILLPLVTFVKIGEKASEKPKLRKRVSKNKSD